MAKLFPTLRCRPPRLFPVGGAPAGAPCAQQVGGKHSRPQSTRADWAAACVGHVVRAPLSGGSTDLLRQDCQNTFPKIPTCWSSQGHSQSSTASSRQPPRAIYHPESKPVSGELPKPPGWGEGEDAIFYPFETEDRT